MVGDITDPETVARALAGCSALLHAAAPVRAIGGRRGRAPHDENLRGAELVVGGAFERGFRSIVYVSSAGALFSPGGGVLTADGPLPRQPWPYARSKAETERYVRGLAERGAPIRISYPPAVVGPLDPGMSDGNYAVLTFLRQLLLRTSSGYELVDARDVAALHTQLVDPKVAPGRYVMAGHYQPWPEVVELLRELTGRHIPAPLIPGAVLRLLGRVGDRVRRLRDFDFPLTAEAMAMATQWPTLGPSPRTEALGVRLRPVRETYADTIRWMHEAGHLTARQAGRLAS